jgi:hypothetical protein
MALLPSSGGVIGSTHRGSQNGSNILETNNRSPPCHDNENGARSYVAPGIDLAPDHREGQQQQPQANIEGYGSPIKGQSNTVLCISARQALDQPGVQRTTLHGQEPKPIYQRKKGELY